MDQFLIEKFDQWGARFQTRWGIGQPTILKNSSLFGIVVATGLFGISLSEGVYSFSFESVIMSLCWLWFYLRRRDNEASAWSQGFVLELRAEALWQRDWVLMRWARMALIYFNVFMALFILFTMNSFVETKVALGDFHRAFAY